MMNSVQPFPTLDHLPDALPLERAVRIELQEGTPVLQASTLVQARIEELLGRQVEEVLTPEEVVELDQYEEMDDYLSFLNRVVRNLRQSSLSEGR
jgi:phosphoglycerate-specific signal transduction histidine kinase